MSIQSTPRGRDTHEPNLQATALDCTFVQLCGKYRRRRGVFRPATHRREPVDFSKSSPEGTILQNGAFCGLFVSKRTEKPFMGVAFKVRSPCTTFVASLLVEKTDTSAGFQQRQGLHDRCRLAAYRSSDSGSAVGCRDSSRVFPRALWPIQGRQHNSGPLRYVLALELYSILTSRQFHQFCPKTFCNSHSLPATMTTPGCISRLVRN